MLRLFVIIFSALNVIVPNVALAQRTAEPLLLTENSSQLNSGVSSSRAGSPKDSDSKASGPLRQIDSNRKIQQKLVSERVGEPECFQVGKEKKCLFYEVVKIRNGLPSEITRVLRCLFNRECSENSNNRAMLKKGLEFVRNYDGSDGVDLALDIFPEVSSSNQRSFTGLNSKKKRDLKIQNREASNSPVDKSSETLPDRSDSPESDRQNDQWSVIWPDDQNSLIFIKDTVNRIRQIKKIIKSLDCPESQVRIEGRIVRANKDWSRGLGILWGGRNNQFGGVKTDRSSYWGITGNQSGVAANTATGANLKQTIFIKGVQQPTTRTITSSEIPSRLAINLPANVANIGDIMGLGLQFGLLANQYITELDFRLQIGEAQGQARTVARPNIQVSNGKNAVIKSGSVMNVQTSSPQWGTNSHLVHVDLKLQVTPKILSDGRIKMIITVTDNEPNPIPTTGELYLEREAHTTMTVGNGETCVIGGIIRDTSYGRREGWPGLMNLPIVGMLFSNKTKAKEIDELLVFISPKIVDPAK